MNETETPIGGRFRAAAALAALGLAAAAPGDRWDFEGDAVGGPAKGFATAVGRWEVVEDGGSRALAQKAESPKPTFNIAFAEGTSFQDVDVSVRLRAEAGAIDRGGGLVWRAKDRDNYYIARYNPLEESLRVYKVEGGKRTQLDHADARGDGAWHTLRIVMKGRDITGWLDGVRLLVAEDATFPDAGLIGLWSKADARTSFDDLTAAPAP